MQRPPSITTNAALLNYLKGLENRVNKVENKGTGTIGFLDEATGVETIIGTLPDGSVGLQEWINDTEPPNQPSTPGVAAGVSFLRVFWDGLDTLGGLPPKDYDKTIIEKSSDGTSDWTAVDEVRGKAAAIVSNIPTTSATYFRLVSVDKNGNRSTPSTVASGTPLFQSPETAELIEEAVQNAIDASDLASSKIKVYFQASSPALTGNTFGDTWFDTDEGNKIYVWTGSAWTSAQDAKIPAIEDLASSKIKSYVQATSPALTGNTYGDTWYNTAQGNKIYVWTGSAWTSAQDAKIPALEDLASSKIKTHFQTAQPALTGNTFGDIWFDTDNGNKIHVWNGSSWYSAQDTKIPAIEELASSKIKTYVQSTSPALTGNTFGDTWYNTSEGNKIYVWTGSAWTNAQDAKIPAIESLASSKTKVYFQTAQPALTGNTFGDTWFDTDDGNKPYVWTGSAWTNAQDQKIPALESLASSKIRVYHQANSPALTGNTFGDTWYDSDDGNKPYVWTGSAWTNAQDQKIIQVDQVAASKTATFFQTTAPATTGRTKGDTWFDTDDGNRIWVWNGSAWADAQDDAITAAQEAAEAASDLASSKIKVYYQAAQPALTGNTFGDTWFDTDAGNKPYVWNGSAWSSAQDASIAAASSLASSKTKTYYQAASPALTGNTIGDTWFDTDAGNKIYVWNGSAWTSAQDAAITEAKDLASSKIKVYFQTAQPALTGNTFGDTWFDTDAGNKVYVWNGSAWTSAQDTSIATAQSTASSALTSANGKNKTYFQATSPALTGNVAGDTWFDTDDGNKIYVWNGSAWTDAQDDAITAAQQSANTAIQNAATADSKAVSATNIANSKNVIISSTSAPATAGRISGDTWFDTDDGNKPYIFNGTAWVSIQDASIATAQGQANTALTTANGKTKTYIQSTSPALTGNTVGDIWIDTANGNVIKTWEGSSWVTRADTAIATAQSTAASALTNAATADGKAVTATNIANSKNVILSSASAPTSTGRVTGDTWFDTDDGNKPYTWNGTAWVSIQDASIAAAQGTANSALTTANGKTKTYFQTTSPALTGNTTGDIWFDTDDGNKVYVWNGSAWASARDSEITAALNSANGKNKTYYQADQPTGGTYATGDTWFDTNDNYKLYTYTGSTWQLAQDAVGAKNAAITAAELEVDKAFAASKTYLNNATSTEDIQLMTGVTPTVVDSATASGGKALQKTGTNHSWFHDNRAKQVFDPTALYRLSARVRVSASATSGGKGFYWGFVGLAADGITYVNASGANSYSSQQWGINNAQVPTTGEWVDYVTYVKGLSAGNTTGAGTLADPKKLHANTRYVVPGMIIDYPTGNGTWEISHWSVDVVDTAGYQAMMEKSQAFYQTSMPSGGSYKQGDIWFDTDDGNKVYVHNGTTFVLSQDLDIQKGLSQSHTTDWDTAQPNKWAFTKYTKNSVAGTSPTYSEISGLTGVTSLISDAASLISNQGDNYIGQLRTIVNVAATKTVSWTMTHDDGARVYVDGISVYSAGVFTSNASVSFSLTAGWHVIDILWSEQAGGDGITAFTPLLSTQVTNMYAPVSLTDASATANTALTSANGKNKVIYSANDATGTTGYVNGDTWFKKDANGVIIGQWEFISPNWVWKTLGNTVIANLDAGKIISGTVDANRIAAGSITADKITIGDFTNLLDDPDFDRGTGWATNSNMFIEDTVGVEGSTTKALKIVANASTLDSTNKNVIPVTGGDKFYVSIYVKSDGVATAGDIHFGTTVTFADGSVGWPAIPGMAVSAASVGTSWVKLSGVLTIPANAVKLMFRASVRNNVTAGSFWWDHAVVRRQNTSVTIADGTIAANSAIIQNGAIGNAHIADLAVGTAEIQNAAVTNAKIEDLAVTNAKIADATIDSAKIANLDAGKIISGEIDAARIGANTITAEHIASGTITAAELAAGSITASALASQSITATALAANSITATAIAAETITSGNIKAGAITSTELAANSVTASAIKAGEVDATHLKANSITATALAAGSVRATAIESDSITAGQIASGAITAGELAAGSVTASAIAANSITATALAAQSITATAIAAETITSGNIKAGAITAAELAAGSVSATALAANSITATALAAQSITATALAAQSITATALGANSITATAIAADSIRASAIRSGEITAAHLSAGSITASAIAAGNIGATALAANSITATALGANSITATAIAGQSITATALAAQSVTASAIRAGSITATAMAADSITASAIAAGAVTAQELAAGSITATAIAAGSITASALAAQSITATALGAQSVSATAIAAQSITATALAAQSITATALAAQSITASAIRSQTITATALAANSITATAIGAQQVTATKMLMTDMEELIPNPNFHPSGEPVTQGTVMLASTTPVSAGAPATYVLKLSQRDTQPFSGVAGIPVKAGDQFYVEAQVAAASTTTRVFNHYIFFSNSPTSGFSAVLSKSQAVVGTWTKHGYAFTVPSGYNFMKPYLQVETVGGDTVDKWEWYVTNWSLRHRNTGELIVDGAIQANHIRANNITASALAAGSITATAIAANSITATALAAQSITATALAAQSVSATALAAQSVTATAIAANTITASALAAGSITATAIGAGSITATAIGAQSITATALAAQSITATAIAAQSIGASAIKAQSITATALAADSVTASAIGAQQVTATELAANSITATAIAANAITASALAAQSITATALGAGSITASALAAGSITATALAAQSITATAIGAQSIGASAIKAQSITATALASESVTATAIKAQTITAEHLAANSITATAIAAGTITASALAAQSITATALGAGSITATAIGAESITATAIAGQSITATALAAGSVTASAIASESITATALAAQSIGATALAAQSITATALGAQSITATAISAEAVTASAIKAGEIRAEHLSANAITATALHADQIWGDSAWLSEIETSTVKLSSSSPPISSGDAVNAPDAIVWSTTRSEVNAQGLKVYNVIEEGLGRAFVENQEIIQLGTFDQDFFSINKAGIPQISMNAEGNIAAQDIEVGRTNGDGTLKLNGVDLGPEIFRRPRGMMAWGQVPINSNMSVASGGEIGLFEIAFDGMTEPARMYELQLNNFLIETGGAGIFGLRARYTTNGTQPTINSSLLGFSYFRTDQAGLTGTGQYTRIIGSNNGDYIRVLISLYGTGSWSKVYSGTGQSYLYSRVLDLGETIDGTAIANTGGGTPYTGSPSVPPAPAKVTKTVEWGYNGVRSYTGTNAHYNYNTSKGYQGLSPAGYGNLKSIYTFPNTITTTIAGSTINGIWLYAYFEHWYNGSGGTARFRLHGNTSLPATNNLSTNGMNSGSWPRAAGRWVAVPSSLWGGFLSGTWKGFGLDGDGTYNTYGIANNARIKITYTK